MKSLLNKKVGRLLDLITLLEVQNGSMDTATLYKNYHYRPSSLASDIGQANDFFSDILEITKSDRVEITYKEAASYVEAYAYAMSRDPLCILLERIFFHPNQTISDMARDLFVSPSTIYRWADLFNEAVKENFDIHLETHPLVMRGDEVEVRTFYMTFFKERYPSYDWPFYHISKDQVSAFLNRVIPMKYGKNFFHYYQCFHYQMAVSMRRCCQGFRLDEDVLARNTRVRTLTESIVEEGLDLRCKTCINGNPAHDPVLFAELLAPFVGDRDAENYAKLVDLADKDPLVNRTFIYINQLTTQICRDFQIHLDNERALSLALHNALVGTFGRSLSRFILYSPYRVYQEKIRAHYPQVCQRVLTILRSYNQRFSLPTDPAYLAYLFYVLCTTWENFLNQLIQNQKTVRILVLSKFSRFHALSLRDQILFYFGNLVEVTLPKEVPVRIEDIDLSPYDLLVSNFRIAHSPIPAILCEGIFTDKDYEELSRAILEIRSLATASEAML